MKANHNLEKVYELLEQFDFEQLSPEHKSSVLSTITEEEYINLRNTVKTTDSILSDSVEPDLNDMLFTSVMETNFRPNIFIRILNQPVKLYQLVASVILILGIYAVKQYTDFPEKNSVLPKSDTIYIQKTDSVHSKLADTIKVIKDKIILSSREESNNSPNEYYSTDYESSFDNIICQNTIVISKAQAYKIDTSGSIQYKILRL